MYRYYFTFDGIDCNKLEKLIDYVETKFKIKYLETRNFKPLLSITTWVTLNKGFKQIVFNGTIKNNFFCRDCNFPIDVTWEKTHHKKTIIHCVNCNLEVIEKSGKKYRPIKDKIIYSK